MKDLNPALYRWLLIGAVIGCVILTGALVATADYAHALARRIHPAEQPPATTPAMATATAKEKLLQRLLDERVAAYARLSAAYDELKKKTDNPSLQPAAAAASLSPPRGENRNSWLERLRTENPERYKQIQEEREQRRQRVEAMFHDQLTRLDERLQTAQSQGEADLVNQIADTVNKLNDLRQQWQQARELPDGERQAAMQQLGPQTAEAYQTLSQLRAQDRQMQLQQLASQIGYRTESDQAQFVTTVSQIIQETDPRMDHGMGFGRGRGGPPSATTPSPTTTTGLATTPQ